MSNTNQGETKYDNFVFYGSWRESLEGFREDFGDEYAKEVLWNIMLASTAGDIETTKKSILGFIYGSVMPNIDKAKNRYEKAIENGKKGGRPSTVSRKKVAELKRQGLTNREIAEELGCSISSIEKANKENRKNHNNLDIDIDNDIDIDIIPNPKSNHKIYSSPFIENELDKIVNKQYGDALSKIKETKNQSKRFKTLNTNAINIEVEDNLQKQNTNTTLEYEDNESDFPF